MVTTTRLRLVPASLEYVRAEINDREHFARMLSAADALPLFLSWLEAAPDKAGWFGWYALLLD